MSDTPPLPNVSLRRIYEEGSRACAFGLPMIFCPYGFNSRKAREWHRGWGDHRDEFGFMDKETRCLRAAENYDKNAEADEGDAGP